MDIKELKTKLTTLEEQKMKLEAAYSQLIGQINLLKSLIVEDEQKNTSSENK